MPDVLIYPVVDYSQTERIHAAVSHLLEFRSELLGPLLEAGPHGLVVLKPNWVLPSHYRDPGSWEQVITHPAVILAVVDCLAERMRGQGTICLCDAPITFADFSAILGRGGLMSGLGEIRKRWPGLNLEVLDLRREIWIREEETTVRRRGNVEDPRGYVSLNLGKASLFHGYEGEGRYFGADYDYRAVNSHHHGAVQEYLISGTPLKCNLFVNLPKMKTHKKTGMTCGLKNLVGINGDKNWLPHYTEGSPENGGDEFPADKLVHRLERTLKKSIQMLALRSPMVGGWMLRKAKRGGMRLLGDSEHVIRNGSWHGNDTCWRMVLDLNRALLYGNADGTWREPPARKPYLCVVDGIVGGEGDGPLSPTPVPAGVLVLGSNPAEVDAVVCRLMSYDPRQLRMVVHALALHRWPIGEHPIDQVGTLDFRRGSEVSLADLTPVVPGGFRPAMGWEILAPPGRRASPA
jgi:uncharacterized protein (DUF362 family)